MYSLFFYIDKIGIVCRKYRVAEATGKRRPGAAVAHIVQGGNRLPLRQELHALGNMYVISMDLNRECVSEQFSSNFDLLYCKIIGKSAVLQYITIRFNFVHG